MKTHAMCLIVASLASGPLHAAESTSHLEWSLDTGLLYTDNATLDNPANITLLSDTIGSLGGRIDLSRQGSRLDASLRADGSYRNYFQDTYDTELIGSAVALIRLGLVGDALTWSLDDTFGQSTTSSIAPATPENLTTVNSVSTGPDLRLRLGSATELVIEGRYEYTGYEELSGIDSRTWTGDASLVRRLSPAMAWSIHASPKSVDYDDENTPDYEQQEVFARLEGKGPGQGFSADLGMGFLHLESRTEQEPVIRLEWTRRLTPFWSLRVDAGSEFQNAGEQFVAQVGGGAELGGTQDVILVTQSHRDESVEMSLDLERPRTTLRLTGGTSRESYPDSPDLDRTSWLVGAGAARRLTQRLRARLDVRYEDRDNGTSAPKDDTAGFTLGLDWRLGRTFFLVLEGGNEERSGDTDFAYDETSYSATLSYRPLAR